MEKVLDCAANKAADIYTQTNLIPSSVLMDRAAHAVWHAACRMCSTDSRILVVCGKGHNGGDGFVTAELLLRDHPLTEVFFDDRTDRLSSDNQKLYDRFRAMGGVRAEYEADFSQYNLIIDALFGIGLSRPLTGFMAEVAARINRSTGKVLSIDLPSGIHTDSGQVMGTAVKADVTVTMSFLKPGLLLYPGASYAGKVEKADIGIVEDPAYSVMNDHQQYCSMERTDACSLLPARVRRSHKGTYGHVLLAAGSRYMGGCAVLAVEAAYRTGCGLVSCMTDMRNRDLLMLRVPEAIFADRSETDRLLPSIQSGRFSAAAAGPGLGLDEDYSDSCRLVELLLTEINGPLILDADALTVLARETYLAEKLSSRTAPTILTPHAGEMSRLNGIAASQILSDPVQHAAAYAKRTGSIVLLKDAATVVTDGTRIYINQSGCDGMACGGSGDVLTGVITGLCAQGLEAFDAACLAAYVHGLAGELAQGCKGARGMLARDILAYLPEALLNLQTIDELPAE